MSKVIKHHGVYFDIDVDDWSIEEASAIAEDKLEDGVLSLSEAEVKELASAWADLDDEIALRNSGNKLARKIEAIETAAFYAAIKGWVSHPVSGHNCGISLLRS